jgi:RNA polymerase sigma factor (sigma-70 family)
VQQAPTPDSPESEKARSQVQQVDPVAQTQGAYVTLLFNRYRASLHRYLSRFVPSQEADELVQETYFRLLRHGETVQLEAMARAFLYRTATNLLRDHHRRRLVRRAEQHVPLDEQGLGDAQGGPEEHLLGTQMLDVIEQAITNMPADTRSVFLMSRFRDMSYPQIARVMNLSSRTVARKMAEALSLLSAAMEGSP